MNDTELASLAAAFKNIVDERSTALRAEIASLRADLQFEQAKNAERRRLESQSHHQSMKSMGDAIINTVLPRLQQLQQRTAELEKRAMPTEAVS
jgi:hypothetical protein